MRTEAEERIAEAQPKGDKKEQNGGEDENVHDRLGLLRVLPIPQTVGHTTPMEHIVRPHNASAQQGWAEHGRGWAFQLNLS